MGDKPFWIAIQSRPKHERIVAAHLRYRGYEEFLPTYESGLQKEVGNRLRPLFPGYLFCKFSPVNSGGSIVTVPGVVRILGYAGNPCKVDEEDIAALRGIMNYCPDRKPIQYLEPGSRVRIVRGPLIGLTGTLTRPPHNDVLVVSVEMLKRAVAVRCNPNDVAPLLSPHPSNITKPTNDHLMVCGHSLQW
jgi:transcription antitermination factor NusG